MSERLPRSARDVTASEFSRQLVEVLAGLVAPFAKRELERRAVALRFRHFAREDANQLTDFRAGRVAFLFRGQTVIDIFPRAPVFNDASALQLGEMARDPRLAHAENLLELGYGKLVFFQEKQEAEPGWIGQELEKIYG